MKHLALLAAMSFCLALSVVAVPPQGTPQGYEAAKKLEAVAKQLNLTLEQKEKLLPILEAEAPKLKAIKSDTTLTNLQSLKRSAQFISRPIPSKRFVSRKYAK